MSLQILGNKEVLFDHPLSLKFFELKKQIHHLQSFYTNALHLRNVVQQSLKYFKKNLENQEDQIEADHASSIFQKISKVITAMQCKNTQQTKQYLEIFTNRKHQKIMEMTLYKDIMKKYEEKLKSLKTKLEQMEVNMQRQNGNCQNEELQISKFIYIENMQDWKNIFDSYCDHLEETKKLKDSIVQLMIEKQSAKMEQTIKNALEQNCSMMFPTGIEERIMICDAIIRKESIISENIRLKLTSKRKDIAQTQRENQLVKDSIKAINKRLKIHEIQKSIQINSTHSINHHDFKLYANHIFENVNQACDQKNMEKIKKSSFGRSKSCHLVFHFETNIHDIDILGVDDRCMKEKGFASEQEIFFENMDYFLSEQFISETLEHQY